VTAVSGGDHDVLWIVSTDPWGELYLTPMLVSPQGVDQPGGPGTSQWYDYIGDHAFGVATGSAGSVVYRTDGIGSDWVWIYAANADRSLREPDFVNLDDGAVGVTTTSDGTVYVAGGSRVFSCQPAGNGLTVLKQSKVADDYWPGTNVNDLAVAGDTLFVARTNDLLVLDRASLEPARTPLDVTGDRLAAHPTGMRLFVSHRAGAYVSVLAPSALTGGK
jgi:hypothetical protein